MVAGGGHRAGGNLTKKNVVSIFFQVHKKLQK